MQIYTLILSVLYLARHAYQKITPDVHHVSLKLIKEGSQSTYGRISVLINVQCQPMYILKIYLAKNVTHRLALNAKEELKVNVWSAKVITSY